LQSVFVLSETGNQNIISGGLCVPEETDFVDLGLTVQESEQRDLESGH
jgi:hypothetical protein